MEILSRSFNRLNPELLVETVDEPVAIWPNYGLGDCQIHVQDRNAKGQCGQHVEDRSKLRDSGGDVLGVHQRGDKYVANKDVCGDEHNETNLYPEVSQQVADVGPLRVEQRRWVHLSPLSVVGPPARGGNGLGQAGENYHVLSGGVKGLKLRFFEHPFMTVADVQTR